MWYFPTAAATESSTPTPQTGAYCIDFKIDPPIIKRINDQQAIIQGKVLKASDLSASGLIYTMTLQLEGGPTTDKDIIFPVKSSLGATMFATSDDPKVTTEANADALTISLRGMVSKSTDGRTPELAFYRSPSSTALFTLSLGDSYKLTNVRYTLTNIDMQLGAATGEQCSQPAEPNNNACGGSFIDQVEILSSSGSNAYAPQQPERIDIVADVIRAHFADTDNSGYPDSMADGHVPFDNSAGNVQIFHPTDIGSKLQFRLGDLGKGLDGDPDGHHDFDSAQQTIGLASGMTFDIVGLPFLKPDTNFTHIQGQVFGDENGNGLLDSNEHGMPNVTVALYLIENNSNYQLMAVSTDAQGKYRLENVPSEQAYRLEAFLHMPKLVEDNALKPVRLIRHLTPPHTGVDNVNIGAWPKRLSDSDWQGKDTSALSKAGFLLPDLQPLTKYPVPKDMPAISVADIERSYPGLEAWYIDTKSQPGHVLLRFGTLALNRGTGPLQVVGSLKQENGRPVYQRIYNRSGAFIEKPVGVFERHESHNHIHIANFERYALRDLNTDKIVASSPKISFCLTDVLWPIEPTLTLNAPIATTPIGWECEASEQSINVGFSDYYGPALPDQWIDITHVPDGTYWLEVEVNPDRALLEERMDNNTVRIRVIIDNPR